MVLQKTGIADIYHSYDRVRIIKGIKEMSFRATRAIEQAVSRSRLNWNLILLLATLGTTLWAGYQLSLPLVEK
jgi:hypothetical protein